MASALVDAHIEGQARLRRIAADAIEKAWTDLPDHNEERVSAFAEQAARISDAAQRQSASLTNSFIARSVERQPTPIDLDALIGPAARNGTPLEDVYRRAFVTTWAAMKKGTPYEEAVAAGAERARSTVEMDVQMAMRNTLQHVGERDDKVLGYERVANPGACPFCMELDGARFKTEMPMALHPGCGCSVEVLTEQFEPTETPDDVEVNEHGEMGPVLGDPDDYFEDDPKRKPPVVGDKVNFDGAIDPATGKPVPGDYSGTVAVTSEGRLMVNVGTAKNPRWLQTKVDNVRNPERPKPLRDGGRRAPDRVMNRRPVQPLDGPTIKGNDIPKRLRSVDKTTLTLEQRRALADYVSQGWTDKVSKSLRSGKPLTRREREFLDKIDKAFDTVPKTDRNMTLHRGVGSDKSGRSKLGNVEPGQVIHDRGLGSTSTSPSVAKEFAGVHGDQLVITAPKGSRLIDVNHYRTAVKGSYGTEREILLPRDAKLVVERIETKKKDYGYPVGVVEQRTVYARLIP